MLTKAQDSHSTAPEFMEVLAQTQPAAGDKSGELESYVRLAALLPEVTDIHYYLAVGLFKSGDMA